MVQKFSDIVEELTSKPGSNPLPEGSKARLSQLIGYAADRFHRYEAEKEKLLQLSLAIVGLSGASISLLTNPWFSSHVPTKWFFVAAVLVALGTASLEIIHFLSGTKLQYTHRKTANIRSWYYRYAVKKEEEYALLDGGDAEVETINAGFKRFSEHTLETLLEEKKYISEDLQQLYVLMIFQSISSRTHQKMISTLRIGVVFFVPLLAFTILSIAVYS